MLGFATEVATTVTVVPAILTGGAVYVAVAPLAECPGVMAPQAPATMLLHCKLHATPPGATSLATAALIVVCVEAVRLDAGCCVIVTATGCAVIVVTATAGFDGVEAGAAEAAVRTTTFPAGTALGAV